MRVNDADSRVNDADSSDPDRLVAPASGIAMFRKVRFEGLLILIAALSLARMVKSSSDPLPSWLHNTGWASVFLQFPTGNQICFDVSVGVATSVLMFFLVVWYPERLKRTRTRRSLQETYTSFKTASIHLLLSAMWSRGGRLHGEIESQDLLDPKVFREYFKQDHPTDPSQDRWDAVANGLSPFLSTRS